jgi:hypothetical protein
MDTCYICLENKDIKLLTCCIGKYICNDCKKLCKNCPYCRRKLTTYKPAVKIVIDSHLYSQEKYKGKLILHASNYKIIELR